MNADHFSSFHPSISFLYFVVVIGCSMFLLHPIFLIISMVGALCYSIYLNRMKAVKFNFLFMIPFMLLISLVNPAFNHEGVTILVYINDNPITLESIWYGLASGMMFITVMIWFSCYNAVMTSDKFIYLFGRIIPGLSLILSMALRFVPKFKAQVKVIRHAQKCIGRDGSSGHLFSRLKQSMTILSILTTWALETAIETADSMKARGYGIKGRTAFSNYRFDARDSKMLCVLLLLLGMIVAGIWTGETKAIYFPAFSIADFSGWGIMVSLSYLFFMLTPVLFNLLEDMKWARIKSNI